MGAHRRAQKMTKVGSLYLLDKETINLQSIVQDKEVLV